MMYHYGFDLYFSRDRWCWASFLDACWTFIDRLWRNAYWIPLPIFNSVILLLLSCGNSLYILNINPLPDVWFANVISHFEDCLSSLDCVTFLWRSCLIQINLGGNEIFMIDHNKWNRYERWRSFLIFYLVTLSIIESRALKSATIIVELSISSISSVIFCFMYFGALLSGVHIYNCYFFLIDWHIYNYKMSFFSYVTILS